MDTRLLASIVLGAACIAAQDCGMPNALPNSITLTMESIPDGGKATFECTAGFTLNGRPTGRTTFDIECTGGSFGAADECIAVSCSSGYCHETAVCATVVVNDTVTDLTCACPEGSSGDGVGESGCGELSLAAKGTNLEANIPETGDFVVNYPDLTVSLRDIVGDIAGLEESLAQLNATVADDTVIQQQFTAVTDEVERNTRDIGLLKVDVAAIPGQINSAVNDLQSAIDNERTRAMVAEGKLEKRLQDDFEVLLQDLNFTVSDGHTSQDAAIGLLTAAIDDLQRAAATKAEFAAAVACINQGKQYDTETSSCGAAFSFALVPPQTGTCDTSTEGSLRYRKDTKELEFCDGTEFKTLVEPDIGSPQRPGVSCAAIQQELGVAFVAGPYHIGAIGQSTAEYCSNLVSPALSFGPSPNPATITTRIVPNTYARVTSGSGTSLSLGVDAAPFANAVLMIIQMKAAAEAQAGVYEFVYASGFSGNSLQLRSSLRKSYSLGANDRVQIIKVAVYDTLSIAGSGELAAKPWDGTTGGVLAVLAAGSVTINGRINADYMGYRGGAWGNIGCNTGGNRGESWTHGLGGRGISGITSGCCSGVVNRIFTKGDGRGDNNAGGGSGGAGTCHGGGGGGGAYSGSWLGGNCPSGCRHSQTQHGWGSPECTRSGGWARPGEAYGTADLTRLSPGSGGGAGNYHSPSSDERNDGGNGGGAIVVMAGGSVTVTSQGRISANGRQGRPTSDEIGPGGRNQFSWWQSVNTQDGSGGAGSGGGILLRSSKTISVASASRVQAVGGTCSAYTGWDTSRGLAQVGASGASGRVRFEASSISGSAQPDPSKQTL